MIVGAKAADAAAFVSCFLVLLMYHWLASRLHDVGQHAFLPIGLCLHRGLRPA